MNVGCGDWTYLQLLIVAGALLACRLELFAHGGHLLVGLCVFGTRHVGGLCSVHLVSVYGLGGAAYRNVSYL